eukprot:6444848-Prymnesium_polylepis.1
MKADEFALAYATKGRREMKSQSMDGLPFKMRMSVTWDHARQEVGIMLFQVWPIDAESAAVISSNTMQVYSYTFAIS